MASGPHWNKNRGTWSIQYWGPDESGRIGWHRQVVIPRKPDWKRGDGKPRKIPPEAHAALARYAEKERLARSQVREGVPDSLRAFLEAHLATYSGPSHQAISGDVRTLLAYCEDRKVVRVEQVTTDVAQGWIDHCAVAEEIAIQTSRNRIGRLSVAWSRAVKRGKLPANPWRAVEPKGRPTRRSRGSWTPAQFDRLLKAARPWLRDVLTVGVHAGCRVSALAGLEWRDVEWSQPGEPGFGYVRIRPELDKAKKGYRVPIGPRLRDCLRRRLGERSTDHDRILAGEHGRPTSRGTTATAIRRACRRAGLGDPDSPNHHMRRTFGRWAVLGHLSGSPIPVYVVSKWLGHASVAMTMRYLDLGEEDSTRFMLGAT